MFLFTTIAELLKRCHGRYTDKQTERCSKITGSFGKDLDRVFNQVMFGLDREHTPRKKTSTYFRDINKYCPPREHSAFSQFTDITSKIKHPGKLGQRLFAIGEEFDFWKRREARARQPQQD
jgi:hypothetical protein